MKKNNLVLFFSLSIFTLLICFSCTTNSINWENTKTKIYSNNFKFIAKDFESRTTYSAPSGTGRIVSSTVGVGSSELIGVSVNKDRLVINLPLNDKESKINKSSLETVSENFTVARKDLDNGNILVNFFLNDQKDINLIKMEVDKKGKVDCSIEGPKQKPLFYVGTLE